MKTKFILTLLLISVCSVSYGQDNPKGKAIVQIFGNFHSGFGQNNYDRGFELERSYLGYEHRLTDGLTIKGVVDIGRSNSVEDYHRIVYIKNAMAAWKKGNFTLNVGLISTTQFNFQEKFWGYRYIMKSFQDQYKFGNSADLGLSLSYKFTEWLSADAILVNGEGYKKIQVNDGLNYGLGVTFTPIKGLSIRLYGGINEGADKSQKSIVNLASFVGYKCQHFTLGAEYNHMLNALYKSENQMSGYSVFASAKAAKIIDIFTRFDSLYKNGTNSEHSAIIGTQIKLGKFVKIAPNFRMTKPNIEGDKIDYYACLNCYVGF